jgi:hypothetical protein
MSTQGGKKQRKMATQWADVLSIAQIFLCSPASQSVLGPLSVGDLKSASSATCL